MIPLKLGCSAILSSASTRCAGGSCWNASRSSAWAISNTRGELSAGGAYPRRPAPRVIVALSTAHGSLSSCVQNAVICSRSCWPQSGSERRSHPYRKRRMCASGNRGVPCLTSKVSKRPSPKSSPRFGRGSDVAGAPSSQISCGSDTGPGQETLLNSSDPLVPPKPKELDSTLCISRSCALCGT